MCFVSIIFTDLKEAVVLELQEGDLFFSVTSYVAENEDAVSLVEGERVYVLGKNMLKQALVYDVMTFFIECKIVLNISLEIDSSLKI
jgi:hypothetical protein